MAMGNVKKEQEKLLRNQAKFELSQNEYKAATDLVDQKSNAIIKKLEQLKVNLSVKFFQNIEVKFYAQFDELFAKMSDAHNQLNEIETNNRNKSNNVERFNTESEYVS